MPSTSGPSFESEQAAMYSIASLATDFVLTDEAWPLFLKWTGERGEKLGPDNIEDRPAIEHLAMHIRELASQACDLAGIEPDR